MCEASFISRLLIHKIYIQLHSIQTLQLFDERHREWEQYRNK